MIKAEEEKDPLANPETFTYMLFQYVHMYHFKQ